MPFAKCKVYFDGSHYIAISPTTQKRRGRVGVRAVSEEDEDIVAETKQLGLFDENMADSVIAFIRSHMDVDTLLIHCYAGQSRSRAIGAFAKKMMGKSNQTYFSADKLWAGTPNEHVYNMLEDAWFRDMLG